MGLQQAKAQVVTIVQRAQVGLPSEPGQTDVLSTDHQLSFSLGSRLQTGFF